ASESAQASVLLTKEAKKQPIEDIFEEVAKPEEEKPDKLPEELKDTGITFDLEKHPEHEAVDVSVLILASESVPASIPLTKEVKKQPMEDIVEEEKPELFEELKETEITFNLEKHPEHEAVDVSVLILASESAQASVLLTKEAKKQPIEDIFEEVAKPEEEKPDKLPEELKDTGITFDLEKHPEHEAVDVSVLILASESVPASIPLTKEAKKQPMEDIVEEEKPELFEELKDTGITFDLEKHPEHEAVDVSVLILASESAQASIPLAKQAEKQPLDIVEEVAKPKSEEKPEKVVKKLEETEITLDLEKGLEHEFVDIFLVNAVSDSTQALVRLSKEPKDEIIEKKTVKPKKETTDEQSEEKLSETEAIINLEKGFESEQISGSTEALVPLTKELKSEIKKKMVKPKEKTVEKKPEEVVKKLEETEITLDLEKGLEHEFVDIFLVNAVSDSTQALVRLSKEPKDEIIEKKTVKPKKETTDEQSEEKLSETEAIINLEKGFESEQISGSTEALVPLTKELKSEIKKKMVKPKEKTVEKKPEEVVKKLEETEITLDLEKSLEHEFVDIFLVNAVSDSTQALVRLSREPKDEIIEKKTVKPKKETTDEQSEEKLSETEAIINLEKGFESEQISGSTEA
ncbi:unnamed protein product, partial [Brugia pahangi]|uniref:Microtubule-associated protein 1B n=1 Tax=Brugia pahangi TaxID=6280 RepID=A0A0N4TC98_BRUPA